MPHIPDLALGMSGFSPPARYNSPMRVWAISCGVAVAGWCLSPTAHAAPCKAKEARIVKRATTAGKVSGKLIHLRKKDGKQFSFNTVHSSYHRSDLTLRWPLRLKNKQVRSLVVDVVAKPLSRPEIWSVQLRNFRSKKWVKLGQLSWRDGGGDKSYKLSTVDVSYYRNKRGRMLMRVGSKMVGVLKVDRLRVRLLCE